MSIMDLNEQELFRRESLAKLRELGIEPYPAALYPINTSAAQVKAEYDEEKGNFQDVVIAGRIMSRRIMGAASFGELQDETGRIQVYINRDEICPGEDKTMYNTVWKKLLDMIRPAITTSWKLPFSSSYSAFTCSADVLIGKSAAG